jgi:hypothetical protein
MLIVLTHSTSVQLRFVPFGRDPSCSRCSYRHQAKGSRDLVAGAVPHRPGAAQPQLGSLRTDHNVFEQVTAEAAEQQAAEQQAPSNTMSLPVLRGDASPPLHAPPPGEGEGGMIAACDHTLVLARVSHAADSINITA